MKKHDIKHHLSKELLLAYSAGQLEEGFSLAIATHISMCDQCRAELESLEAMGGAVFENLEPNSEGRNCLVNCIENCLEIQF